MRGLTGGRAGGEEEEQVDRRVNRNEDSVARRRYVKVKYMIVFIIKLHDLVAVVELQTRFVPKYSVFSSFGAIHHNFPFCV